MAENKKDFDIFEVFVQETHLDSHIHVGSLVAASPDLAMQMARENFLRRDQAVNLWVVSRSQITATSYESPFFSREMDKTYREVSGYTENGRLWRMFKEKDMDIEEIVAHVREQSNPVAQEEEKPERRESR
ncbi:phenylacetic acid degradation protein [Thermoactinomyces mirandus]|uniref:Phenylacetic acid degradation protein n=1 Tax=Thermoactinomyces mirandus TaxID=2756294 RepID=A0A7W1XRD1_9BACL|nr:phenylacetic acid degradation protein [Thermoactinomyces mirandus]MBA4601903.1 phenylacetic acid degradation protein [Thermoactinomyces mirandus]